MLGSGVPIIAFVIAPCGGDDPPAKGCSAFVAMNELSLLLNKDYNEYICNEYGEYYRNPLNALIYLPLLPAFSKIGNIVTARREMDEMVVDLLYLFMDFDLADLLGGIGTEVGLTNNSAHTLGMLKVTYPVEDYISAFKLNFEGMQLMQESRKEKLDILDEVSNVVKVDSEVTRDLFKNYLIKTGTFDQEQFEEKLRNLINSNPRLEEDITLHVKGIEIQVKNWLNEIMQFLSTIKLMGKVGPIEEAIINLTLRKAGSRKLNNLEALLVNLTKTHLDFSKKKEAILDRLSQLIPSSQVFTLRQKKVLEDLVNISELAEKSLGILKFYDETRYLTEALIRYYEALPECKVELEELKDIQTELATIYLIIQLMLRTPSDESRMIDEHLAYINGILARRLQKRGNFDSEVLRVQETKKRKEFDKSKMEIQVRKFFGGKRYAREQLLQLERDLKRIEQEEEFAIENLDKADSTIKLYEKLGKRFELVSEYRKRLNKIVELQKEYTEKIATITAPKRYFEKCTDLTESEQLKIIFKILTEQEETLTRKAIFKHILDMDHYRDYMKSVVRAFKTPSIMGFKPTYKTDYIWVTVSTPPNMWTEDMSQEVYTALAGYVTSEVSRTITVRVVESRDEWETKILVVGGRGKPEDLESYDEMQLLYSKSNDFERYLSRSYLLEQGLHATRVLKGLNNHGTNNTTSK